jgi:hypothetical protein
MSRIEEVAECTLTGLSPAHVAERLGIALSTTLDYLERAVGRGLIRRSDICFTIPLRAREVPATAEAQQVMERFGDAAHALGDMYEDLRGIECCLHSQIRDLLISEFGPDESGWWRQGIPEPVRMKCQQRRESDPHPLDDPYCYVDLLGIHDILKKSWPTLSPLAGDLQSDRPKFLEALARLNEIRRMVMHPARGTTPREDDFQFVADFRRALLGGDPFARQGLGGQATNATTTIRLVSSN